MANPLSYKSLFAGHIYVPEAKSKDYSSKKRVFIKSGRTDSHTGVQQKPAANRLLSL
jgi:hypothetical protein